MVITRVFKLTALSCSSSVLHKSNEFHDREKNVVI
jgi:hypothetical protein